MQTKTIKICIKCIKRIVLKNNNKKKYNKYLLVKSLHLSVYFQAGCTVKLSTS